MNNKIIKVGIGVIVLKNNEVLMGHRNPLKEDTGGIYEPDTWTLPGGKQEYEETIIECAKREVKEETNLDIDDIEVFSASDDFGPGKHYITVHTIARTINGDVKVMEPDTIDEWKFFPLDNLPENIYSPSKKTLSIYKERTGINE